MRITPSFSPYDSSPHEDCVERLRALLPLHIHIWPSLWASARIYCPAIRCAGFSMMSWSYFTARYMYLYPYLYLCTHEVQDVRAHQHAKLPQPRWRLSAVYLFSCVQRFHRLPGTFHWSSGTAKNECGTSGAIPCAGFLSRDNVCYAHWLVEMAHWSSACGSPKRVVRSLEDHVLVEATSRGRRQYLRNPNSRQHASTSHSVC